jgi:excisionase family DNA binding protein
MRNTPDDIAATLQPLAVTPRRACDLLAIGKTRLFELLREGELKSYLNGGARRIPLSSLQEFQARKLAEGARP